MVRVVAKVTYGLPDGLLGLLGHPDLLVDNLGNRLVADPGVGRDLFEGYPSRHIPSIVVMRTFPRTFAYTISDLSHFVKREKPLASPSFGGDRVGRAEDALSCQETLFSGSPTR
jgi:hypothetical protein